MNRLDAPEDVRDQLGRLTVGLRSILGELVGIYVHGSLVLGCFNPQRSDVDVIVVSRGAFTEGQQRQLAELALSQSGPKARPRRPPYPLELSVLTRVQLRPWRYPTPFEFHYGESLRQRFEAGDSSASFSEDHDLAAHVTVLHEAGVVLAGPPISDVFPVVPRAHYVDSLLRDLSWTRNRRLDLYGALNASRVWATLAEQKLHSKLTGALWALDRAPDEFKPLVDKAVAVYRGDLDEAEFEPDQVAAYLDYVGPIAARYAAT